MVYECDATTTNRVIQLTTNPQDKSLSGSVGRVTYKEPMHLWDKVSGNLADFTTKISFVIESQNKTSNADGFAFFLASNGFTLENHSGGGTLALIGSYPTLYHDTYSFAAVVFDTFQNDWDPPRWMITLFSLLDEKESSGSNTNLNPAVEIERVPGPGNFSYKELVVATNQFADFGRVYLGFLKDLNSEVAVKKITPQSDQGMREYLSELQIISRLRHRNLVQLIGWCYEKQGFIIVYESGCWSSFLDSVLAAFPENFANKNAKDCKLVHSDGRYSENLAWSSGDDLLGTDAVKMWISEKDDYDYNSNTCAKGRTCEHYTQVVWQNSTKLGCARVRCNDGGSFVSCNYYPSGNIIGQRPYEIHIQASPAPSPVPNGFTPSYSIVPPTFLKDRIKKIGITVGLIIGAFIVVLCFIWFILRWKKKRKYENNHVLDELFRNELSENEIGPRKFSYGELASATNNFGVEEKLGEGGFGAVYRGFLRNLNIYVALPLPNLPCMMPVAKYEALSAPDLSSGDGAALYL
ncbi:hypothetical protein Patl1_35757 [Pistacia atlantica]|nr:hypothetical protein Patl1_35757 [Pistacia atlantica]